MQTPASNTTFTDGQPGPWRSRIARLGLLGLLVFQLCGCRLSGGLDRAAIDPNSVPAPATEQARPALPRVAPDQRLPIAVDVPFPVSGAVPAGQEGIPLRQLTLETATRTAAEVSPLANALVAEGKISADPCCGQARPSGCLQCLLQLQANHERTRSAGQAAEAYWQLVETHLQMDLLNQSTAEIDRVARIVSKLRENDIDVDLDERELLRQQNLLEEKAIELHAGQRKLVDGLELLLDLHPQPDQTLWTSVPGLIRIDGVPDAESAVELAWQNRQDLAALHQLADCCGPESMEWLPALTQPLSPWLGLRSPLAKRRGLLAQRKLKQALQLEADCRCEQLPQLVALKRAAIRREVLQAVRDAEQHARLVEIKRSTLESLEQSLAAAEKAVDIKPLDFKTHFENKGRLLQVRSEWVHELLQFQIQRARLMAAQGLVAESHALPPETILAPSPTLNLEPAPAAR